MYKLFKELGKKIVKVRIYEHVVLKKKVTSYNTKWVHTSKSGSNTIEYAFKV